MSVIDIQQPYLTGGIRSVNFFNGRLLSGEDLSKEQEANREAHKRLGIAVGTGIVSGFEVLDGTANQGPAVAVKQGIAINPAGQTLTLTDDVTISLSATSPAPTAQTIKTATFSSVQAALTRQGGLDEGVYLLTVAPTVVKEGFSPVIGFQNTIGFSSNGYLVEALQFRLFPLTLNSGLLGHPALLRNRLAYACFGFTEDEFAATGTPGPLARRAHLLDTLLSPLLEDVPLALLFWTNSPKISFIDCWSVRRPITRPAATGPWQDALGPQRVAEAEAMFLQFQDHITDILQETSNGSASSAAPQGMETPQNLCADQLMSYLPPAGCLPIGDNGFDWRTFLGTLAPSGVVSLDPRQLRLLLHNAFFEEPIKVGPFAHGSPANEAPVDVFQDAAQPGYVFFARATTGQVRITVDAQGYQPTSAAVSLVIGQQTAITLPLLQKRALVGQRPLFVDVEHIERPVLNKIRLSMVQQPPSPVTVLPTSMIKVNPLPQNVVEWLGVWQTWLNGQYPNRGIDVALPAIYLDDYYAPSKEGHIPENPSAYAVFGDYIVPLLLTIAYYITPLPVPLARTGIRGLTTDVIQALAASGIVTIDHLVGAWTTLIADATGESLEYGKYLISDAIEAVMDINTTRRYYQGITDEIREILEQMALSDDVALANADQRDLGQQLNSKGFALRLITQAREAVPSEHWSLEGLKLKAEQIQALQKIEISSKGGLVNRAETSEGRKELQRALGMSSQMVDDLHTNAYAQMIASSMALARIKDMVLLTNVNAVIANQLATAEVANVQELASIHKTTLMEVTGMSEDAAEDLQHEARHARIEGLEVVHLASVTKGVADALNDVLGIRTIEQLSRESEEKVVEVFKQFHGDRAVHFVKALFDGIGGSGR